MSKINVTFFGTFKKNDNFLFFFLKLQLDGIKHNEVIYTVYSTEQGSSNLSLEVQSAAEFSSNPDQTHLAVIF